MIRRRQTKRLRLHRRRSRTRSRSRTYKRKTTRKQGQRQRQQRRRQRGGMYNSIVGSDGIPRSEHDSTVVIKTIDGVPTAMSAETYERDYKATGEDVGQI